MLDPTYPLFPIFAFLGILLCLIPLPWHLQAWNSGTCYFMLWTSLACANQFVNAIIWADNALNPAPWWCEISIRILMGASVGIPASSLCIVRRLYQIASVHSVAATWAEKRRAVLIDTLICVLFPTVYIALQYVVQGHRFNILEGIGCYPAIYNTLLAYFISMMWPLLLGIIAAVYCVLTLVKFNQRRMQFNQFLSSHTTLTVSRYFRLMALAMTQMMCTTPLAVFTIVLNATATEVGPWRSWEDTHFAYSRVEQIPALFWRSNRLVLISMEFTRWVAPFCAFVFFVFFGFAEEAKKNYGLLFAFLKPTKTRSTSSPGIKLELKSSFKPVSPYPIFIDKKIRDDCSSSFHSFNPASPTLMDVSIDSLSQISPPPSSTDHSFYELPPSPGDLGNRLETERL